MNCKNTQNIAVDCPDDPTDSLLPTVWIDGFMRALRERFQRTGERPYDQPYGPIINRPASCPRCRRPIAYIRHQYPHALDVVENEYGFPVADLYSTHQCAVED